MVIVVVVATVFFFFLWACLFCDKVGYAESGSHPPWVWIYCPHIVDDLISRWNVLELGFGLRFLLAETMVGRPAGFFAE